MLAVTHVTIDHNVINVAVFKSKVVIRLSVFVLRVANEADSYHRAQFNRQSSVACWLPLILAG